MTSAAPTSPPQTLLAMLDELEPAAMQEVALLLEVKLGDPFEPYEPRDNELGFLAQLLTNPEARGPSTARATPRRTYYDQVKPAEAPKSQTLCDRYGSWTKACRAAQTLTDEASRTRPWSHGFTGRHRPPDYDRDEIIRAVLKCATAIGRMPSSHSYYTWAARERRRAKQTGKTVRCPAQRSVERFFKSWSEVRAAVVGDPRPPMPDESP